MQPILDLIKRILPKNVIKKIRPYGHGFLAYAAAMRYGFPSRKMIVAGITGTAGKSSTIQMFAHILNSNNVKCGYSTTVGFCDGSKESANMQGLSMPGRFALQRHLKRMLANRCQCALVECTSEGLAQNRHLGINFDIAAITNLSQAHLDAHGGIENYRKAKARLFSALEKSTKKDFFPKKIIAVNLDDDSAALAAPYKADLKIGITSRANAAFDFQPRAVYRISGVSAGAKVEFKLNSTPFALNLPGEFNAANAAFASAIANVLGVSMENCASALAGFAGIAGRMQFVPNKKQIQIIVDYAPEPIDLENALRGLQNIPHKRIIHVFGSTGGHRDVGKRFEFGEISARHAQVIILTNDDVYESDPEKIIADIHKGIENTPPAEKKAVEIFDVPERKQALKKALDLARPGDIIIATGKGSERFLVLPGNRRIAWDEVKIFEDLLSGFPEMETETEIQRQ